MHRFYRLRLALASALALLAAGWVLGESADEWRYWSTVSMPVEYFIEDTAPSIAAFAEFAAQRGIDQWGDVASAYFDTSYQGLSADLLGRSCAKFMDLGGNQTGGMMTESATIDPWQRRFPVRFEVHLDDDRAGAGWTEERLSKTAAHELGHTLDLGHVDIPTAVMYYTNHTSWQLHQDEIDATSFLHAYPSRRPIAWWRPIPAPSAFGVLRVATPFTVTFDASYSEDPDGTIVEYRWNFADGTTLTTDQPVVAHTYQLGSGSGWIMPRLEVVDDSGRFDRIKAFVIDLKDGPDSAPPVITVDVPTSAPDATTEAATVTVGGSYSDDLEAYQGWWTSDRGIQPPQGHFNLFFSGASGRWQVDDIPLLEGANTLTFYVEDFPGNVTSDSIVVTRPGAGDGGALDGAGSADAAILDDAGGGVDAGAARDATSAGDGASAEDGAVTADATASDRRGPVDGSIDDATLTTDARTAPDHATSDRAASDGSGGSDANSPDHTDGGSAPDPAVVVDGCACTAAAPARTPLWLLALLAASVARRRRWPRALAVGATLVLVGACLDPAPPADLPAPAETRGDDRDWRIRHGALWAAFHARAAGVDDMALHLSADGDPRNRRAALEILGYLGPAMAQRASAPLLAGLADADGNVRQAAITALGQLRIAAALAPLGQLATSDHWTELRRRAALVQLDDAVSCAWLDQLQRSRSGSDRYDAAMVLALIGPEKLELLRALLEDDGLTGRWLRSGDPPTEQPERVRHGARLAIAHLHNMARVMPGRCAGVVLPAIDDTNSGLR